MLAHFARFLQHVDIFFAQLRVRIFRIVGVDKLRQAQSTGHASRPAADDDNVGGHLRTLYTLDRFAENQHRMPNGSPDWLSRLGQATFGPPSPKLTSEPWQ